MTAQEKKIKNEAIMDDKHLKDKAIIEDKDLDQVNGGVIIRGKGIIVGGGLGVTHHH